MFDFETWYNENRSKILVLVVIALGIVIFIQVVNNFYKVPTMNNTTIKEPSGVHVNINNDISGKLDGTSSLVDGSNVSSNSLKEQVKIIDDFIKFCNDGDVDEAYELLTDECKSELFSSLEIFKSKYYDKVFNVRKTYNVQNWTKDTYRVKFMEDILSTGNVSNSSEYFQEYMTVVKVGKAYKLNINNYVGLFSLNKSTTVKGVTITAITKNTYMDYSEYVLKVQNNTNRSILLDSGDNTDSIYLLDKNNVSEYANTGEIVYDNLRLIAGEVKTFAFKFSNSYSSTREMQYLVFENVILDYEKYMSNRGSYDDFTKVMISI